MTAEQLKDIYSQPNTSALKKGRGYIRIDVWFWEDMGGPETIEAFRKALLIPDTYEIESIESAAPEDLGRHVCKIVVRHPAIPVVAESEPLPLVKCNYIREGNKARLDHIDIDQRVDDEWKTVYTDVLSAEESPYKQVLPEILIYITKEPRTNKQHKDVAIQCLEVAISSLLLACVGEAPGKDEELPLMMDVLQGFVNRLQGGNGYINRAVVLERALEDCQYWLEHSSERQQSNSQEWKAIQQKLYEKVTALLSK